MRRKRKKYGGIRVKYNQQFFILVFIIAASLGRRKFRYLSSAVCNYDICIYVYFFQLFLIIKKDIVKTLHCRLYL